MSAFNQPESDSEDELPPGWEERATLEGEVYYANHNIKLTQWTHPRTGRKKRVAGSLPFGWERKILPDGKIIYVDHENQKTTYSDPRLAFAVETDSDKSDFRQRFDASTSCMQILHGLDLSTRLAVVTGANSGIGFETARSLAMHGCKVILACRDQVKGEQAVGRIRSERANVCCQSMQLDLSSLSSVRLFAAQFLSEYKSLDILILNAGVFGLEFKQTEDQLETMFQVNFLSHFYLCHLLKSAVAKSTMKKIVVVSAEAHRFASISHQSDLKPHLLSPPSPECFVSTYNYNNSKLFCLMFALEAHKRWNAKHNLRIISVHPGNMVSSSLSRNWWIYRLLFAVARPFSKSVQQAASPTIFAAATPEMATASGIYINNCFPCLPSEVALNENLRKNLWDVSKQLVLDRLSSKYGGVKSLCDL